MEFSQTRYRRCYCIDVTIVLVKSYESRYMYIYNKAGEKKRRRWLNGEIDRVCLYYIIA